MNIAILSGKGGTGKTTLSMNLGYLLKDATLFDADVEEPNLRLFLEKKEVKSTAVQKEYPVVDEVACTLCGKCGDFCRYNAILPARKGVLIHKELCHDCGGCALVCTEKAITYAKRSIGEIVTAKVFDHQLIHSGILTIGEVSGVAIIEALREMAAKASFALIDSPPGTSCATVAAVEEVDYAIIVTEPTPFGLSDMKMVVEMLERMQIPFGVVINKAGIGDDSVKLYCEINNYPILGVIPFKRAYAEAYSKGELIAKVVPEYQDHLKTIIKHLPFEELQKEGC